MKGKREGQFANNMKKHIAKYTVRILGSMPLQHTSHRGERQGRAGLWEILLMRVVACLAPPRPTAFNIFRKMKLLLQTFAWKEPTDVRI